MERAPVAALGPCPVTEETPPGSPAGRSRRRRRCWVPLALRRHLPVGLPLSGELAIHSSRVPRERLRTICRMTRAGVDTPGSRDFPTGRRATCRKVRWKVWPRGLRFPPLAAPSALPFPAVLPDCGLPDCGLPDCGLPDCVSPQDGCHLPEGLGQRQIPLGVAARLGRVDELLGEQ